MAPRRPKRRLSEQELEDWRRIANTLQPLATGPEIHPEKQPVSPSEPPKPVARKPASLPAAPPPLRDPAAAMRKASSQLDKRTYDRFRKGKIKPDRRIDLHGMTAAEAHNALNSFILSSVGQARVVLVITGKGSRGPDSADIMAPPRGVLRRSLPHWLSMPPLREHVLQVLPAKDRDGGDGAFYVYLKRRRG